MQRNRRGIRQKIFDRYRRDINSDGKSIMRADETSDWPHAPAHRLSASGTYMVTAATYQKEHFFARRGELQRLHDTLLAVARAHQWRLEAWAVFSNHYHFIAHSPAGSDSAESLRSLVSQLHAASASALNTVDGERGRKVWHNFWETGLTFQNSYLARLNYVHQNAVKHGLVREALHYPWCSAGWLEKTTSPAIRRTLQRFGMKQVNVADEFEPVLLQH